jgi:hypothetical protein
VDTAGSANNDLGSILERLHVVTDAGSTNTRMALNAHEVANCNNDLLDLLCKLTGRSKDQGLALLDVWVDFLKN